MGHEFADLGGYEDVVSNATTVDERALEAEDAVPVSSVPTVLTEFDG